MAKIKKSEKKGRQQKFEIISAKRIGSSRLYELKIDIGDSKPITRYIRAISAERLAAIRRRSK